MKFFRTLSRLFFSFCLANTILNGNLDAQTARQSADTYKKAHADDSKYLEGFDEKAIVAELKNKGVRESEYRGIINGRKHQYISKKRGIAVKRTFSDPIQRHTMRNPSGCPNANFEDTTFTGWTAGTGDCSNYPAATVWTPGFVSGPLNDINTDANSQQDLLTDPAGYDPVAGLTGGVPNIPYIAPGGGNVSVRLGNAASNYGTEFLKYSMPVTVSNTSFAYQYAVVLEDASGHTANEQPRFTVNVIDQNGNPITGPCGAYNVDGLAAASDPSYIPFYTTYSGPFGGIFGSSSTVIDGYYKKWTPVNIDLTPYIGTTVSIEFVTMDCTAGAHYGYAYIDASCSTLSNQILFCPSDTTCLVIAPSGFSGYQWYNSVGTAIAGATGETLHVSHPFLGEQFSVSLISAAGCPTTLYTTLAYSHFTTYQNHQNATCGATNGWAYVNQSGVAGPFTYTWIDSSTHVNVTQSAHPDSLTHIGPGTYYVTVQATSGCNATDTIRVTQPNPLTITHVGVQICPTATSATLTAPAGSGYQWYNTTNAVISGATSSTYSAPNPAVGQTYSVHYNLPTSGCSAIEVDSFYNFNANVPIHVGVQICPAATSATLTAPSGSGYQWYDATNTLITGATSSTYSASNPTIGQTYSVHYTLTGGCQGIVVDSFYLFNVSAPIHIGVPICPNSVSGTFTAPAGSGYQWYDPTNTLIAGATNATYVVQNPLVGQNYTVNYVLSGGCATTAVDSFYLYQFSVTGQTLVNPVCNASNGQASVTVTAGLTPYVYSWAPTGGSSNIASGLSAGTYTINVSDAHGCSTIVFDTVTNTNGVGATVTSTPITCHNGSDGSATASPVGGVSPFTYSWNNGAITSSISNLPAGNYCVTITASNGCTGNACVNIVNPPPVLAQFYAQPSITDIDNPEILFINQSTDATNWQWDFGDNGTSFSQNPVHTFGAIGNYPVMLIATNSKGCVDTVYHTVIVNGVFTFYAPNAFAPQDMSSSNNVFLPRGTGWDNTTFKMQIFDRWGNFLFYSDDVTKGWDGRNKGAISQIDVYVWKVTVDEANHGKEHDYIGSVTIVR